MSDESILHEGKIYISTKQAAEKAGYTIDYVGQLARAGKIKAIKAHRAWFIDPESLDEHKNAAEQYVPVPPQNQPEVPLETIVGLDGVEYISAKRGADMTSYSPDYVTQLARTGKVPGKHIGGRWYVAQERLVQHKAEKDALLAAVQAESAGVRRPEKVVHEDRKAPVEAPLTYMPDERTLLPTFAPKVGTEEEAKTLDKHSDSGSVARAPNGAPSANVPRREVSFAPARHAVSARRAMVPAVRQNNLFALTTIAVVAVLAAVIFSGSYLLNGGTVQQMASAVVSSVPDSFLTTVISFSR